MTKDKAIEPKTPHFLNKLWTEKIGPAWEKVDKEKLSTILLLAPYIILFVLFIVIPVIVAMGLSFTYFNVIEMPVFAKMLGFYNYIMILTQDEIFLRYVLPNT